MRPIEMVLELGRKAIKENDGVSEFNYDILQEHL
jgi:hypothetical protein